MLAVVVPQFLLLMVPGSIAACALYTELILYSS
jgi:hypothetical protein